MLLSCYEGNSALIIEQKVKHYVPKGGVICDKMYGEGNLWKWDKSDYDFWFPDIEIGTDGAAPPACFEDDFFDCVVDDPPYGHDSISLHGALNKAYRGSLP